jgi:hypothetical protein
MKNIILKTFVLVVVALILQSFAHGSTYYVDDNAANDSGSGLKNSPKENLWGRA